MDIKDLVVVAVITPKKCKPGKSELEIFPDKSLLKKFKDKNIFFAETRLQSNEFFDFFDYTDVAGTKWGLYFQNKNSDLIFKQNLLLDSGFVFEDLDYTKIYRDVLSVENEISKLNPHSDLRIKNGMKADLLFSQTFLQAEFLLKEIKNSAKKIDVLYVNLVVGYSMHLLSNCKIFYDIPSDFSAEKLKADIEFAFEAYKINSLWDRKKDPDFRGYFGSNKPFEMFIVESSNDQNIKGFISDINGMQFFTGNVFNNNLKIRTKYFVNGGMLPDRWHLINCHSEKEMIFDISKGQGVFMKDSKSYSFEFMKNPYFSLYSQS